MDYMPLFRMLDDMNLPPDDRQQLFRDVQYCESIALKTMRDNEPG